MDHTGLNGGRPKENGDGAGPVSQREAAGQAGLSTKPGRPERQGWRRRSLGVTPPAVAWRGRTRSAPASVRFRAGISPRWLHRRGRIGRPHRPAREIQETSLTESRRARQPARSTYTTTRSESVHIVHTLPRRDSACPRRCRNRIPKRLATPLPLEWTPQPRAKRRRTRLSYSDHTSTSAHNLFARIQSTKLLGHFDCGFSATLGVVPKTAGSFSIVVFENNLQRLSSAIFPPASKQMCG
jgi:hypothetical protein